MSLNYGFGNNVKKVPFSKFWGDFGIADKGLWTYTSSSLLGLPFPYIVFFPTPIHLTLSYHTDLLRSNLAPICHFSLIAVQFPQNTYLHRITPYYQISLKEELMLLLPKRLPLLHDLSLLTGPSSSFLYLTVILLPLPAALSLLCSTPWFHEYFLSFQCSLSRGCNLVLWVYYSFSKFLR